jgi:hypothetical protein|nr:hypothetical protein [Aeromicrobium sp.]
MKRLVVGVFVSALTVFGLAPAASAAPSSDPSTVTIQKAKKPKAIDWDIIDWDAAKPAPGGVSTFAIDWD